MGNQLTKDQLRRWLDREVKEAKNPDPRKIIKNKREARKKKVAKKYGLK